MAGDMFRIETPSQEAIDAFHENGYAVFPAVFTDAGLAALTDEILSRQQVGEGTELESIVKTGRTHLMDAVLWVAWFSDIHY